MLKLARKSNLKRTLIIAFNLLSFKEIINKLKMMIGIFIGAKNILSLKHLIKLDFILTKGSIILGIFIKFVGKIYCRKILNDIEKDLIKKVKHNKLQAILTFL